MAACLPIIRPVSLQIDRPNMGPAGRTCLARMACHTMSSIGKPLYILDDDLGGVSQGREVIMRKRQESARQWRESERQGVPMDKAASCHDLTTGTDRFVVPLAQNDEGGVWRLRRPSYSENWTFSNAS